MILVQYDIMNTTRDYERKRGTIRTNSGRTTFEAKTLTQLRKGKKEYVFHEYQINGIRAMLNSDEKLVVLKLDTVYELRLKRGK